MGAGEKPKIAVALSGGGARGLAHIGVLEWFEQHRIPIDYLAGTSMGGLIGGLYCMGIDPKQLRQIVQEMNWDQLLSAAPAYADLSFRKKEDRDLFPSLIELGWRKGLQVQSGLSDAHAIGLLLSRLTLPYSLLSHFDELPTPYRAVSADMVSGERVVLEGLTVTAAQWSTHLDGRRSRERQEQLTASFVEVSGPSQKSEQEVAQRLEKHSTGDLQTAQLESDLNSIYGLGRYRSLTYRGVLRDLQEGLLVETHPKTHGPPFIHLAFEVNGAEMDDIRFGVRSRLTFFDVGGYGSEWRVDLGIGPRLFAASEYYRPVGGGFFIAPRAFAQREIIDLFEEGDRSAEYRSTSAGVGLDLGYGFGSRSDEIRLGYQLSHIDASVRIGDPLLPPSKGRSAKPRWDGSTTGSTALLSPEAGSESNCVPAGSSRVRESQGDSPRRDSGFPFSRKSGDRTLCF